MSSKTVIIKTAIPNPPTKNLLDEFTVEVDDDTVAQTFEIEYIPASQGGPLMRPKNPPA